MNPHHAGDITWLTFASLESVPGLVHAVSTRTGGVSRPPYASLNLGFHVEDSAADVLENRRRFAAAVDFPRGDVVTTRQVHETTVRAVTREDRGTGAASTRPDEAWSCDALVTRDAGVYLMGFSADCPLVMLVDASAGVLGLAHAGWRSAFAGIIAKTVAAMQELGAQPSRTLAAVSPAIGPCCYEVGAELKDALPDDARVCEDFFRPVGEKFMLDLPGLVGARLVEAGVLNGHVETAGMCSRCCPDAFFSYRRDGRTGRYAVVLGWGDTQPSPR